MTIGSCGPALQDSCGKRQEWISLQLQPLQRERATRGKKREKKQENRQEQRTAEKTGQTEKMWKEGRLKRSKDKKTCVKTILTVGTVFVLPHRPDCQIRPSSHRKLSFLSQEGGSSCVAALSCGTDRPPATTSSLVLPTPRDRAFSNHAVQRSRVWPCFKP